MQKIQLNFRISESMKKQIIEIAKRKGYDNYTEFVRKIVENYVNNYNL